MPQQKNAGVFSLRLFLLLSPRSIAPTLHHSWYLHDDLIESSIPRVSFEPRCTQARCRGACSCSRS